MGFLTEKIAEVRRALEAQPLDDAALMSGVASMPPPRRFVEAISSRRMAIIAEVKRSSPSAGRIAEVDPASLAETYEAAGADAISVLTEGTYFGGSLSDLWAVHLGTHTVPVLRKDFLVHPRQVVEARARGADAVLLISACLNLPELEEMLRVADDLGLGVLLETHSDEDLSKALSTEAPVIGVNSRDLETLEVDELRALALLGQVPPDRIAVFESGVSSRAHVERAQAAGASVVLVGEALMRAADPAAKIGELLGGET
jgi:indole-3-glycerol phosphate synthase